uniref:Uncharacterized protein n=1 Tax=Rhizophora mucronata TaxID=61149 RepID=A0A2P2LCF2_RHIMU
MVSILIVRILKWTLLMEGMVSATTPVLLQSNDSVGLMNFMSALLMLWHNLVAQIVSFADSWLIIFDSWLVFFNFQWGIFIYFFYFLLHPLPPAPPKTKKKHSSPIGDMPEDLIWWFNS